MESKRYRILYEDEHLIVVDKPSGMLVIPSPRGETNTLTALLNRELDTRGVSVNAYPCHRIDRETSGIVLFAKGKRIQQIMMEEFKKKDVKKLYTAFVHGRPKKDFDIISTRIYNKKKRKSEEAVTRYSVLDRFGDFTVIEAEPVTGRTNQIRIHLKGIGHPLVGESVFAFRKDFRLKFRRAALHARKIEFTHPETGKRMVFESPLSDDMKKFYETRESKKRG